MDLNIDYENELNHDQLAAVMAPADRPALVLAGAGSGKTRTLTYRVAWLISECQIHPRNILLLTFTNKASAQMLERIETLTGFSPHEFWGGTFHSIGCKFLRIHANTIGLEPNFTILDAEDSEKLLKSVVEATIPKFFSSKDNPRASLLFDIISFARNTRSTIAEAMMNRYSWIETPCEHIEKIAEAYRIEKRKLNSCDFDDLLELWYELLLKNPDILARYCSRFQNILVDEYQDTNRLQSAILDLLADRGQLSAVGDDAQCIYSWRGAEIENILTFKDRYPAANIYKIERNYRSSVDILQFANQILAQMPTSDDYRKTLVGAKQSMHKPFVLSALDGASQGRLVSELIREVAEGGVYEYSDIAVLYRSHFQAMDLQLQLQYKNIPFTITSGLKFFEQAHIKDVISQLKFAANQRDFISFRRFVRFLEKIGDKTALKIYETAKQIAAKKEISIADALSDKSVLGKVPAVSREAFAKMAVEIATLAKSVEAIDYPTEQIAEKSQSQEQLMLFDDIPIPNVNLDESTKEQVLKTPQQIVKDVCSGWYKDVMMITYDDYLERVKDFDALLEYSAKFKTFEEFLANAALEISETYKQEPENTGRVRLMTVHQAKGLEFPVVFVIGASEGLFPTNRSIEDGDVEEERRLFYVASTRAMEHLIITYPKVSVVKGEPQVLSKSRFLEGVDTSTYSSSLSAF